MINVGVVKVMEERKDLWGSVPYTKSPTYRQVGAKEKQKIFSNQAQQPSNRDLNDSMNPKREKKESTKQRKKQQYQKVKPWFCLSLSVGTKCQNFLFQVNVISVPVQLKDIFLHFIPICCYRGMYLRPPLVKRKLFFPLLFLFLTQTRISHEKSVILTS